MAADAAAGAGGEVVDVSSEENDVVPLAPPWGHVVPCPGAPPQRFRGYRRGRELGSGASSRVFVCSRDSASSSKFAAKITNLRRLQLSANAERERVLMLREVEIFRALPHHKNIVRMFDAFQEGNWFFMVLELVGEGLGDLFTVLTSRRPARLQEPEARHVLRQLVDGVAFLHSHGIVHRDLKLENVLVASEHRQRQEQGWRRTVLYEVKITDFGLSKAIGGAHTAAHSVVGTRPYMAPEVDDGHGASYDYASDVWCLGVLLFVLLAGRFPFDATPASQLEADGVLELLRGGCAAKPLISGMLQVAPPERLSLRAVAAHEWLRGAAAPTAEEEPEATGEQQPKRRRSSRPGLPALSSDREGEPT